MERNEVTISWASLWKVLAFLALLGILFVSREIFIAVILAVIISAALDLIVDYFEARRIPRILSTIAIYIIGIFILAVVIYIAVPIFLVELNTFVEHSGQIIGATTESFGLNQSLFETLRQGINEYTSNLLGGRTTFISILSQFLGGLVTMVVIFVLSFYLTIGRNGVEKFFLTVIPETHHVITIQIYEQVRHKISRWFMGQLFLSLIIGVLVFVGLSLLDVRYAFILAITAAILELIPYVGPIFSGAAAALIAFGTSTTLGVYTVLLFIIIQQFENHILVPAVNKYTTSLDPVIVIIALLIGAQVFGITGIVLAVPLAVAGQEILRYRTKQVREERRQEHA